jgi:hypothetical protein
MTPNQKTSRAFLCHNKSWIGDYPAACKDGVEKALDSTDGLHGSRPCLIEGHCDLETLTAGFVKPVKAAAAEAVELVGPSRMLAPRIFVVALLREPVARVFSEYVELG